MIDIDKFASRHIGPRNEDIIEMLKVVGSKSLDDLIEKTVPDHIIFKDKLKLRPGMSEEFNKTNTQLLSLKNNFKKTYIGMGYYNTTTPSVILRNILENPGWYTAYTPYQPEVSQGRLEMLMNFQQMIIDLTGMDIANASLLDESTAAAEAMMMAFKIKKSSRFTFCIQNTCHPQTLSVLKTRAKPLGIKIIFDKPNEDTFGCLIQNPDTYGEISDLDKLIQQNKQKEILSIIAADIMSLVIMKSPRKFGADIVIGSSQRFGVPMGLGGPHAAFFATLDEYKRMMPGRLIGVSVDRTNKRSYRMALQTREQHIRREKATSNICTAQALLAIISASYAIYHGPERLKNIANSIHHNARYLKKSLEILGFEIISKNYFDTLLIKTSEAKYWVNKSIEQGINFRLVDKETFTMSLDETTTLQDVDNLVNFFNEQNIDIFAEEVENRIEQSCFENGLSREDKILTHPVFNIYHSETEMMRYLKKLENKDVALNRSMIPLGSCTMKLNATAEMIPISWRELAEPHPFVPIEQMEGYRDLFTDLKNWLRSITGFSGVSLQPNAGAQGEYAGLMVIRKYHLDRGEENRNICLIPSSAHGTNPASAQMVGMKVVVVDCDKEGNVDFEDLKKKAEMHSENLGALMVTYPSTHGVFEEKIKDICEIIHQHGGQVYMDGANLNALVGVAKPGNFGPDVCHINLHKTFCIPHGGGGPGMGPIACKRHLQVYLPNHPVVKDCGPASGIGAVSAAPWGSSSILSISWMYIKMMGSEGVKLATQIAILNANYIAYRLKDHYPILYKGSNGNVAHECIIDIRSIKSDTGISEEDIAKRLIDYGFHAPTMSWPVAGTMMIEPTESESLSELDRFCNTLISIKKEIDMVKSGKFDKVDNPIKNAPHTDIELASDEWNHKYSREQAAYPAKFLKANKFWPPVARVDNVYGDKNIFCTCPSMDEFKEDAA